MSAIPAAAVLLFGASAIALCLRQRDPRVPFIAVLGLIMLTVVSAGGIFVVFNAAP
jgi:hypothetical protein